MSDKNARRSRVKWTMIPIFIVLLALLMVVTRLPEVTWVSSNSQTEERRMPAKTKLTTANDRGSSSEKIPLYVITASGRPALLTRGLFYMLPFLDEENNCGFDVHWIVVHTFPDERLTKAPLFRNVFPWITELFTYNEASDYGDHERNFAIEHILNQTDTGLVYFLDDDNVLSMDICRKNARSPFRTDHMYYANEYRCERKYPRLPNWDDQPVWRKDGNVTLDFVLLGEVDTANWLTPVWLFRQEYYGGGKRGPGGVTWLVRKETGSDGWFFTGMVKALLQTDGTEDRLVGLPPSSVKFHYNHLTWCLQEQLIPWTDEQLNVSLNLYRDQIREMQTLRESLSFLNPEEKMSRTEVSFHEYAHILHVLRSFLPPKEAATYVEIGVWKGASSIFMSRHPLLTHVIGIDEFIVEHQREEAEGFARHLKGKGTISWIKKDSKLAIPELREQLNGTSIDILFVGGNDSMERVRMDFELHAPLVSEGGYIVFDGFMDTKYSSGVREAVMYLIQHGQINLDDYDAIGCVPNTMGAGPVWVNNNYLYDWQSLASNEFVLRKTKFKKAK